MTRYAEDLTAGAEFDLGSHEVSRGELVSFAERWDPQSFHVDRVAAGRHRFGDVIASGAHTLAVAQRLCVLAVEREWAVLAGVELRQVRFVAPVRPDTVLHGRMRIEAVVLDRPRERGLVTRSVWLRDDRGLVLEFTSDAYVLMRETSPGDRGA